MIEVYLADMTESHIIYINDVLVEEGYAVSCEQVNTLLTSRNECTAKRFNFAEMRNQLFPICN